MKKQVVDNIAIYMRLSSEDSDDKESESIKNQRQINYDFINKYFEYENCYEYVDDGYSGTNFDRPAFKKMIEEINKYNIQLVVTKNLARFARNYIDSGEYIEKIFPNMEVRYIAVLDRVDNFSNKMENEFAPFKGLFNEMYCRETSRNIKRTKRKKMEGGFYSCPIPPYGYKKNPENPGRLIIDDNVAPVVEKIFMMKYDGMTSKEIAKYLNEKNIITPARYLNIFKNRDIDIWTGDGVSRLLSKPVYVGDTYMGKTQNINYKSKKKIYNKRENCVITKNTHEPIIGREIFDTIHNNNKYNNHKRGESNVDTKLGDFIYCGYCNKKIGKVNKNENIVLYCSKHLSSDELCANSKRYNYKDIEEIVLNDLKEEVEKFLKTKRNKDSIYKKYKNKKLNSIEQNKRKLEKQKFDITFKISELYNDRLDKKINDEQYQIKYKLLVNERKNVDELLNNLEKNKQMIENENEIKEKINQIKKVYRSFSVNELNKEDLSFLIRKIELTNDAIKVYFTFKEIKTTRRTGDLILA